MNIDIVICTERGYLEAQSKLLVYSIRKYGGILKDAPIFSYQPRRGKQLDQSTIDFFEQYHVHHVDLLLNTKYHTYPLANKPIVCAHREALSSADQIIFIDSDTFFFQGPDFILDSPPGLYMRPVDIKLMGANEDFTGKTGLYWQKVYELLDVKSRRTINTTVSDEKILEYYNSGLVINSPSNNLYQYWLENFEKVMAKKIMPHKGLAYVEQSVLSATISSLELQVKPLPTSYNYPLHLRKDFVKIENSYPDFRELSHVHYHKLFMNRSAHNPYQKDFNSFKTGRDISEKLVKYGVVKKADHRLIKAIKLRWKNLLNK